MCNAMQRNENHFARVTFPPLRYPHRRHWYRHRTVRPTVVAAAAPPHRHRRFHTPPLRHRRYHTATSSPSPLPHLTAAPRPLHPRPTDRWHNVMKPPAPPLHPPPPPTPVTPPPRSAVLSSSSSSSHSICSTPPPINPSAPHNLLLLLHRGRWPRGRVGYTGRSAS